MSSIQDVIDSVHQDLARKRLSKLRKKRESKAGSRRDRAKAGPARPPPSLKDLVDAEAKKPWVLGVHTLIPRFRTNMDAVNATILRSSGGKLPPYCVAMGDARRVRTAAALLDKGSASILNDVATKFGSDPGRVVVAVGRYKGTPVVLFEHQMGGSAAEILCREIIAEQTRHFGTDDLEFSSDAKYLIRVGSAAGINMKDQRERQQRASNTGTVINLYDCVVASKQVGVSSADVVSLVGGLNALEGARRSAKDAAKTLLKGFGYSFTDGWPVASLDAGLVKALQRNTQEELDRNDAKRPENTRCCSTAHMSGNMSKDSLYAETDEKAFIALKENLGVGTSEMEFATIVRLSAQRTVAYQDSVKAGMVTCIFGLIPGESFARLDESKARACSRAALVGALETLHEISQGHAKPARGSRASASAAPPPGLFSRLCASPIFSRRPQGN